MFITLSIVTAFAMFFVTRTLVKNQRPKSVMLHIFAATSALVAGVVAFVSHADQERRLRAYAKRRARRDAIRRQEEDVVLNDLRWDVASGIDERIVRYKGIESSERIGLLTYVKGAGTHGRGAAKIVASGD